MQKQNIYILNALSKKYEKLEKNIFLSGGKIGLELEFILVPFNGKKPDFDFNKKIFQRLVSYLNFLVDKKDQEGYPIKASNKDEDIISFEYGYSILEISLSPKKNIHEVNNSAFFFIKKIQDFLNKNGLRLLPCGINPLSWIEEIEIVNDPYYQSVKSFLKKFNLHKDSFYNNALASVCSVHVHLELDSRQLPVILNLLNRVCWIKALLFSNSFDFFNKMESKCCCLRDPIWQESTFSYDKRNSLLIDKDFKSYDEVLLSILENSIFCVQRTDKLIFFKPIAFKEYINREKIKGYLIQDSEHVEIDVIPEISDIYFLRPYNPAVITSRGTIEIRSECQQPFPDLMSSLAFHVGLLNNHEEIEELLKSIDRFVEKNSIMREKAIFQAYQLQNELSFDLESFIYNLLLLIKKGLLKRNLKEEIYLECLFERLKNRENPAIVWMKKIKEGKSLLEIIDEEAQL